MKPLGMAVVIALAALTPIDSHAAPANAPRARAASTPHARPATDEDRALRLEDVLTLSAITDPVWSPDGKRIAFVVNAPDTAEDNNNQDLWLADLARGDMLRLTRHPKNDFSPTFSPGGDTIAFIGTRASGDDAKPAIYMLSLRGGEPWAFGSYDESVGEVQWSPDGRWLAYVKTDTLSKTVRDWRKKKWDQVIEDERIQHPRLWIIPAAGGTPRALTAGTDFIWSVRWSPDSRSIAYITSPTGKPDDGNLQDLGLVSIEGGAPRKLGVIGTSFAWSPDSRWIALASHERRDEYVNKTDLYVVPAAGGRAVNLTSAFDHDAELPCWNASSDTLFFHAAIGVSTQLASAPRAGGAVTLGLDRASQAGAPVAGPFGRFAWIQSQPLAPAELWVADHADLPGRAVTTINASAANRTLAGTRIVRWTSSDGVRIEGLLLRPANAPDRALLKTLVLLHGGPYGDRYALGFQSLPQYFASHGYQVFMPNFRSSGGYGTAFMLRHRSEWGMQDWRDVTSGIDSLIAWKLVDGARLGVYGGSYGGYLSAWAITQTDRFKAACVIAGAVDLAAHYGQSDIQKYRAWDFEGSPWETPENWKRSSPMTYIRNVKTPTQILIGEADPRVPYPQGQELYRALVALRVPTEFVHYPREGHGLREPRHRADQFLRMLAWFDRWIK
ncbi:MAG: S9 family peptidase [Candidatus Eisenbacteria bacterium]|nr:S9 family peptidase [Candidatus Eisenbacteria bacterium]